MNRLTILIDNGLDEVCFEVPSDREGLYNILDVAELDYDERAEILLRIAERLKAYEDTGMEPEDILSNIKTLSGELNNALEELKEYKELEKQGRLIKLPCGTGDTVYLLSNPINVTNFEEEYNEEDTFIFECEVNSMTKHKNGNIQIRLHWKNKFVGWYFTPEHFGKVIFPTQKEAEKALKEQ